MEVRFQIENVWLTQKLMAEIYECTPDNISVHLRKSSPSGNWGQLPRNLQQFKSREVREGVPLPPVFLRVFSHRLDREAVL